MLNSCNSLVVWICQGYLITPLWLSIHFCFQRFDSTVLQQTLLLIFPHIFCGYRTQITVLFIYMGYFPRSNLALLKYMRILNLNIDIARLFSPKSLIFHSYSHQPRGEVLSAISLAAICIIRLFHFCLSNISLLF